MSHRSSSSAVVILTSTDSPGSVALRSRVRGSGYRLAAFLPAAVLAGFDPGQNPKVGVFYVVRDSIPSAAIPEIWYQIRKRVTDIRHTLPPSLER